MGQIIGTGGNDTLTSSGKLDVVEGLGGDDSLTSRGGDTLSGGAGDDRLWIRHDNDTLADTLLDGGDGDDRINVAWWGPNTLTINGGAGADTISVIGGSIGAVKIAAGDGDDRITVVSAVEAEVTLGAGRDIVGLEYIGRPVASLSYKASLGAGKATILDFTPGAGGDQIDLGWKLAPRWDGSSNPFTSGDVRILQEGRDVVVQFTTAPSRWTTFVTLVNVDIHALTAENFCGLDPKGGPLTGQSIDGGASNDSITGYYTADTISGGDGADTLRGGPGDDFLDGGAGWDEAVYFSGWARDASIRTYFSDGQFHTLVRPGSNLIIPVGAPEGVDTLVNVEFVRFADHSRLIGPGIQGNQLANFDGGSSEDVLVRNIVTGQVSFVDTVGYVGWGGLRSVQGTLETAFGDGRVTAVGSGDLNSDGRAEIIVQNGAGGLSFIDIASGSPVAGAISANLPSEWKVVGLGDMTLDGTLDVVIRSSVSGNIMYAEMDGTTFSGWGEVFNMGLGWRAVDVGDVDRDGDSDVLVQEIATGTTYYVQMQGGAFAGWNLVAGGPGAQWVAKEAADLNGDGYFDVVFQNSATGQIWYVNMAGGVNSGWGTLVTAADWAVVGSGDYDNDGYADVLVQSPANGDLVYIDVNNGVTAGWGAVKTGLGTDWVAV